MTIIPSVIFEQRMNQMLIWGYKFFSRKLCNDSLCNHSLWLIFTAWSSQVSFFLQNDPKSSYIFTKVFVNPRHSNHSLLSVCCVITFVLFSPSNQEWPDPSLSVGLHRIWMLLQHHFHFLKSCNFSTICILILQSVYLSFV